MLVIVQFPNPCALYVINTWKYFCHMLQTQSSRDDGTVVAKFKKKYFIFFVEKCKMFRNQSEV
jgi:hypothetical protein